MVYNFSATPSYFITLFWRHWTVHPSYRAGSKLKVVAYALEHRNQEDGREFGVNEASVRRWLKAKNNLIKCPKSKRANSGKLGIFPELEEQLAKWICEKCNSGIGSSIIAVRLKA